MSRKISKKEVKKIIKEEIELMVEERSSFLDKLTDTVYDLTKDINMDRLTNKYYDFAKTDFFGTTDSGPQFTTREKYEKETQDALKQAGKATAAAGLLVTMIPVGRAVKAARAARAAATAGTAAQAAGNTAVAASQAEAASIASKQVADIVRKELASAGVKKPGWIRRMLGLGVKGAAGYGAYKALGGGDDGDDNKSPSGPMDKNSIANIAMAMGAMGLSAPKEYIAQLQDTLQSPATDKKRKYKKYKLRKGSKVGGSDAAIEDEDVLSAEEFGSK